MSSARLRGLGIAAACLAVSAGIARPRRAASKYPPDPAARGFNGGAAGWQSSTSFDGSCLAPLLCPAATNSFQPAGGADGGGFIRSAYSGVAGVMAVAGTTTAVWQSPPFSYEGVDGDASPTVSFAMDRRASVGQLLAVAGNSADFAVRLVDVTGGGEASTLVGPSTLAGADSWTAVRRGSIDPGQLAIGHEYRIQITTRYTTGTSVLVSGNADYDNVELSAVRGRRRRRWERQRRRRLSDKRLGELVRAATPATAILTGKGKRLLVRVKCPRKVGRTCRITAQGLLKQAQAGDEPAHGQGCAGQGEAGRAAGQAKGAGQGGEAQTVAGAAEGAGRQGDRDRGQEPQADPPGGRLMSGWRLRPPPGP